MASARCDVRRALPVSALRRRVSVSRMLEICMSGSMRGRELPSLPTRLLIRSLRALRWLGERHTTSPFDERLERLQHEIEELGFGQRRGFAERAFGFVDNMPAAFASGLTGVLMTIISKVHS